jgi:hypothetical protein
MWVIPLCNILVVRRRFGIIYRLQLQGKMRSVEKMTVYTALGGISVFESIFIKLFSLYFVPKNSYYPSIADFTDLFYVTYQLLAV